MKTPPSLPPSTPPPASYPLTDLCVLADLPIRTVRYYVQIGLVDRPEGGTRAARYGAQHLEQLLLIKKWTSSGVSLERIRELLHGAPPPAPPRARPVGTVSVCSHLTIAEGVEVVIDPGRAGLSPEQVRRFVNGVMDAFAQANCAAEGEDVSLPAPDATRDNAIPDSAAQRPTHRKARHDHD